MGIHSFNAGSRQLANGLRTDASNSYATTRALPPLADTFRIRFKVRVYTNQLGYVFSFQGVNNNHPNPELVGAANMGVVVGFSGGSNNFELYSYQTRSASVGGGYIRRVSLGTGNIGKDNTFEIIGTPTQVSCSLNGQAPVLLPDTLNTVQSLVVNFTENGLQLAGFNMGAGNLEYYVKARYYFFTIEKAGTPILSLDFSDGQGLYGIYENLQLFGATFAPWPAPAAPTNLVVNNDTRLSTWDAGNNTSWEYELTATPQTSNGYVQPDYVQSGYVQST